MLSDDAPNDIPDDFGFHHDLQTVQYAHFAMFVCHILPEAGGLLDQDARLIDDIIRYHNLKEAVQESDQKFYPPDTYEEQELDDEIKRMTL
jgi:ribosomal protein S6